MQLVYLKTAPYDERCVLVKLEQLVYLKKAPYDERFVLLKLMQ